MIKLKISFRFVVTIISIIVAVLLGLTRISDPEFVQVLRLKYFDMQKIKLMIYEVTLEAIMRKLKGALDKGAPQLGAVIDFDRAKSQISKE